MALVWHPAPFREVCVLNIGNAINAAYFSISRAVSYLSMLQSGAGGIGVGGFGDHVERNAARRTPRAAFCALLSARFTPRASHRAEPHPPRCTPHASRRTASRSEKRATLFVQHVGLGQGASFRDGGREDKAEQGKAMAGGGGGDAYPVHGEEGADDEDREREEVGV